MEIEASKLKKIHWVIVMSGKIKILQGVGHLVPCLGVCYANDPPKGWVYGVYTCARSNNLSSRGRSYENKSLPLANS